MKNKTLTAGDLDARIHYCMTYIGGFMGTYTVFSFAGSFGNAGTANMISIFTNFFKGNIFTMMLKILGLLIYSLGITLAVWLPKHTIISTKMLSLKLTCACGILIWLLPDTLPPTVGLYPTFFAMSCTIIKQIFIFITFNNFKSFFFIDFLRTLFAYCV